jgi:hypothetical protein
MNMGQFHMSFALKEVTRNSWLSTFETADQALARQLADSIRFVSDTELKDGLWKELLQVVAQNDYYVAVFTEREQKRPGGRIERLYKESAKAPKTAYGAGPRPVDPKLAYDPKVGSEGIIAQLLSQFCKEHPKALFHPSIAKCIKMKVRRFILVTDIIGSGDRATDWLKAAWRTATLRSWHSYGLLSFEIVAFTATILGEEVTSRHPSKPTVRYCLACPTIASSFASKEAMRVRSLCLRYDPLGEDPIKSLGHGGTEALIAFSHSIPNNVPRLLIRGAHPLFRQQITRDRFEETGNDAELDVQRLERLKQIRLAEAIRKRTYRENARRTVLFLAASSRGPRTPTTLSRRTGLALEDIRHMQAVSQKAGWTDLAGRLTDSGHRELDHARRFANERPQRRLPGSDSPYYPQALRAPLNLI